MSVWNRGFGLTWLGHSAFRLETKGGRVVYFDPFLEGNPSCPEAEKRPARCDLIVLTHAHGDHAGDVPRLAKLFPDCPIVCGFEVANYLGTKGIAGCRPQGKGGTQRVLDLAFTMVHATHSSSFDENGVPVYGGEAGYVVTLEDGTRIYNAGDTGVTADMQITAELYAPEIAMLPIGDHFTMGPREAAFAARLLRARWIVPMHYGTWPVLTGTPEALRRELATLGLAAEVLAPKPGETVS